ncbi:MAG: hypothetical protein V3S97_03890 [Candidatus Bathyarchaeia archaeon]
MLSNYTILHGLISGATFTGYIFLLMITLSPRIWGYQDYPDSVKKKVPPQTKRERTIAGIVGIPFIIFALGFPIYSVLALKTQLGGEISFVDAFIHLLVLVMSANLGDLVILDWLIISKITPSFVVIPGSEVEDYKDFSHHYKGHIWASLIMILLCGIMAVIISR